MCQNAARDRRARFAAILPSSAGVLVRFCAKSGSDTNCRAIKGARRRKALFVSRQKLRLLQVRVAGAYFTVASTLSVARFHCHLVWLALHLLLSTVHSLHQYNFPKTRF